MNICECGCGKECNNKFVHGHNNKGKSTWNKGLKKIEHPEINFSGPKKKIIHWSFCECGCEQRCRRNFVQGHNNKGRKLILKTTDSRFLPKSAESKRKNSLSNIGKISWNTGLTKETDNRIFSGKRSIPMTEQGRRNISAASLGRKKSDASIAKRMLHSGWHKFPYISSNGTIIKMRSSWEVLYAEFMDLFNIVWQYEPRGFMLSNGHYYFPDFYLPKQKAYHEVKGYISAAAKEKMDLFCKEYSEFRFEIIDCSVLKSFGII